MKVPFGAALLSAVAAFSQTASQTPTEKPVAPDTVVAIVDGRKVTAGDLEVVLRAVAPATRQVARRSSLQFLQQYGLLRRLAEMAEKNRLHERSPLREQLEYNRMLAMAQAQLNEAQNQITVSPEEARQHYEAHKANYAQARVKVLYIPFRSESSPATDGQAATALTESEAKAKAEALLKQARSGADFVALIKQHSGDPISREKGGDFGVIRRSDNLPEEVKAAVFGLKLGEISDPVRQPNGYYLFRLEELREQPFEEVQSQIVDQLRQQKFNEWMQATQSSIEIKVENEAFFQTAAPQ
ncbi:MAG: peptidylprolyl isomerase [Bryobacterales bacterium]|nr:peptidylprolyl isomerase [Bryobacteraceae bacterium]MDW8353426.1 peptidylprolyl isomerase [Bryobacterales bacterium]